MSGLTTGLPEQRLSVQTVEQRVSLSQSVSQSVSQSARTDLARLSDDARLQMSTCSDHAVKPWTDIPRIDISTSRHSEQRQLLSFDDGTRSASSGRLKKTIGHSVVADHPAAVCRHVPGDPSGGGGITPSPSQRRAVIFGLWAPPLPVSDPGEYPPGRRGSPITSGAE